MPLNMKRCEATFIIFEQTLVCGAAEFLLFADAH